MTSCAAITFDFISECGSTTGCNVHVAFNRRINVDKIKALCYILQTGGERL